MIWLLLLSCKSEPDPGTEPVPTPIPTEDTAVEDTGPPTEPVDTSPPLDCSSLPELSEPFETLTGFTASEDFDFDLLGNHVSLRANGNLVGIQFDGETSLLSPNVASIGACTRRLPDGNFVVCRVGANSLVHVDVTTGAKNVIVSGLSYPNGADVSADGRIFVAEQNASRLRIVDPTSGDSEVIATNLYAANGVVLSPDESTVFVGSFGGGTVYAVEETADGWETRVFAQTPSGQGEFDGIEADACGNIYVTEYLTGKVWQISADGQTVRDIATLPSDWIPNLRWGTGIDGWDPHTLYVSDRQQGRLFTLSLGLPGAGF